MTDIWTEALRGLRPRLGPQTYEMWLMPIQMRDIEGDLLRLSAPNRFLKDWFETHYLQHVLDELKSQQSRDFRVDIAIAEQSPPRRESLEQAPNNSIPDAHSALDPSPAIGTTAPDTADSPYPLDSHPSQLSSPLPPPHRPSLDQSRSLAPHSKTTVDSRTVLHPRYRFDSYIRGSANELAASAAMAVADQPGNRFNPLFIYGGVGLGKTHLLQGIAHSLYDHDPRTRIAYLSAERFMNEFIGAVRHNQFDEFRRRYREDCDCLLIDDIQFIAGRDRTMEEFFHVFNTLYESGKQIVVTADRTPGEMTGMEERLISRLNWGLVADVKNPDLETRIAILQQKSEQDHIKIPSSALQLIAQLVASNVRELEGALLRVAAFAELRSTPVTDNFVREVLGKTIDDSAHITIDSILKAVASYFNLRVADLKGTRRHRGISRPRMIAMYLARELTDASYPEIGHRFGGKDHSTVINACRRVPSLRKESKEIDNAILSLSSQLQCYDRLSA